VPGIGPKTAAALMKEFDSLDDLYADLGRVAALKLRGAKTLSDRLSEYRESAYLARQLTRITCDMELGVGVEGLRRRAPDIYALGGLYDHLGFGPFLRRQGERLAQIPMGQAVAGGISARYPAASAAVIKPAAALCR
jgi:DNA polymerase-1